MKEYIGSNYGQCQKDHCECLKQRMNFAICSNWKKFEYASFEQMIADLPAVRNEMERKIENKDR